MTKPMLGTAANRSRAVSLDPNHPNAFVIDAVEKFCPPFDQRCMTFSSSISEGRDGEHIARTFYAADDDDARQTQQKNYADEPIVEVHH